MNDCFKVWSRLIALLLCISILPSFSSAEDFSYPELSVTPLASERIQMERSRESDATTLWMDHIGIFVPATLSIFSGLRLEAQKKDLEIGQQNDASDISKLSIGIGAAWIGYASYLALTYRPYTSAQSEISTFKAGSKKDQLIKERLSEEKIEEAGRFGRTLSWLSAGTMLLTSVGVASYAKADAQAYAIAAGVTALAPLLFTYRWQKVSHYHSDYKKRIYGPIVTSGLYGHSFKGEQKWAPQVLVGYSF
ncbi:hypothetical protein GW916_05060 [bacterium]|nr:hypothetical protein [bacterium]